MSDSKLDYANPQDLPPPGTGVSIEIDGDDTVVVIPPAMVISQVITAVIAFFILAGFVSIAVMSALSDRRDWVGWTIFVFAILVLGTALCLTVYSIWKGIRMPTVIRANRRELLLVKPSILSGKRLWKVSAVGHMTVSMGSPGITGRMIANLRLGNWATGQLILTGRDKAELLWIARAINRAMGKV